jgi:hypothetical protein
MPPEPAEKRRAVADWQTARRVEGVWAARGTATRYQRMPTRGDGSPTVSENYPGFTLERRNQSVIGRHGTAAIRRLIHA